MTVACFIYQEIYCRYLSPGECVIHDRGPEFANETCEALLTSFGTEIRMTTAGRPQGNGQVERAVQSLKQKIKALMSAHHCDLPSNWDQTLLYAALSVLRSDPASASGYAPASLLLGRELVYPVELQDMEIDLSGTEFTVPVVNALYDVHNLNFGVAAEKIKQYQDEYKRKYDKKHKVQPFSMRKGARVQVLRSYAEKSGKMSLKWKPRAAYYVIEKVLKKKSSVMLKNPRTDKKFKKLYHYSQIRKFRAA